MTILHGREFNLKVITFLVIETVEKDSDQHGKLEEWICDATKLLNAAYSLSYFKLLNLWFQSGYNKTALGSTDYNRLKTWRQFLSRCHRKVPAEFLQQEYNRFESRLQEHEPEWCHGFLTKTEFDVTVRHFLHSPLAISAVSDPSLTYLKENSFSTLLNNYLNESEIEYQRPAVMYFVDVVKRYFLYLESKRQDIDIPLDVNIALDESCALKDLLLKLSESLKNQTQYIPIYNEMSSQLFLDYLYSEDNSIWDPIHNKVWQNMDFPLSCYWIASSHNTYLNGDQYSSQSTVESYIRALQQGCKCIEIDIWNGPGNKPIVTHGRTLCTSVALKDVLLAVKEYAFVKSDYPLIISIENHCDLAQQRVMAKLFQETFETMLITKPLEGSTSSLNQLPSPKQLHKKIILKGRKLPWVYQEPEEEPKGDVLELPVELSKAIGASIEPARISSSSNDDPDSCDCLITGELFKSDNNGVWVPCIFTLTNRAKLFYTEKTDYDDIRTRRLPNWRKGDGNRKSVILLDFDLHADQPWFHGQVKGGRATANELLKECGVNGTFLVRNKDRSSSQSNLFVLSVFNDDVHHFEIHTAESDNEQLFHLRQAPTPEEIFSSLYELIQYYKNHPLDSENFHLDRLVQPVPLSKTHENEEWFYKDIDRKGSERILEKLPFNGIFLGRYRTENRDEIVISFRIENVIKHCHIKTEGRYLTVSNLKFPKLENLVQHYKEKPFYRDIKLILPVGNELFRQSQQNDISDWVARAYACPDYINSTVKTVKGKVRAIQSYSTNDPDLLSYKIGDIITNVVKDVGGWWWGTLQNGDGEDALIPKQFISSFVEEIEELDCPFGDILGTGEFKLENASGAKVKRCQDKAGRERGINYYIQFKDHDRSKRKLGAACSKRKVNEWVDMINHAIRQDRRGRMILAKMRAAAKHNIASEFSDLIVYSSAMDNLCPEEIGEDKNNISVTSIKSLNEVAGSRLLCSRASYFVWYHQYALTRIYPKGLRLDSSNYDPVRFWNFGCQEVALNYQTADKATQLNRGKFLQNGNCGYVLKPEFMINQTKDEAKFQFDPTRLERNDSSGEEELCVSVNVIAARHLQKDGGGSITPLVEIELVGVDVDCTKVKTQSAGTGLNPDWNYAVDFRVRCPELAMVQFRVCDMDTFSDKLLLGEATVPVNCMREGYRSIRLRNAYGEPLLSALLVRILKSRR